MTQVDAITDALLAQPAMLALPRYRVLADVRERFGCSDYAARHAFARARVMGHARGRRDTVPHVRMQAA